MLIALAVFVGLALPGSDAASAVAVGGTYACKTASGPPFYVIVGVVEPYGAGREVALVTIDDPELTPYRGLDATAVDAEVLVQACTKARTARGLSPRFEAAVADWRAQFAAGSAGVWMLPPQEFADFRKTPLPPHSGAPFAPGERRWGVRSFCTPGEKCAAQQRQR